MKEATEMHNAVRKDDIRVVPGDGCPLNTRRRPVCVKSAELQKRKGFALFCDTEGRNVGGFRCPSDRKDGWAGSDSAPHLVDHR